MTTIDYTEALRERLHSRNVAQVIKRRAASSTLMSNYRSLAGRKRRGERWRGWSAVRITVELGEDAMHELEDLAEAWGMVRGQKPLKAAVIEKALRTAWHIEAEVCDAAYKER